jgi:kynurenine formamidase
MEEHMKRYLALLVFTLIALVAACDTQPGDPRGSLDAHETVIQSTHGLGNGRALKRAYLSAAFDVVCPPVPTPGPGGWGALDEAGNTNTQGAGTACRAGLVQALMSNGRAYSLAQTYESGVSPNSAFAPDGLEVTSSPTFCLEPPLWPLSTQFCGHSETLSGDFGGQGTQLDFFGHAGRRPVGSAPSATVFYNGFDAASVQAGALGADEVKPILTVGVLLDAVRLRGAPLAATDVITKADVQQMLHDQGLGWLGLRAGMVVLIYTGKGDTWQSDPGYYSGGPGLAADVVTDLYAPNFVVLHGLDNPFSDQADFVTGTFASGPDPANDPFPVHAEALTRGVLQVQNLKLGEMAEDGVYLFAFTLAAPRIRGAKGAMVNPIVFGSRW